MRCEHFIERNKKREEAQRKEKEGRKESDARKERKKEMATGQSPDADADARKSRPVAGAGVRGYIRQVLRQRH